MKIFVVKGFREVEDSEDGRRGFDCGERRDSWTELGGDERVAFLFSFLKLQ